MLLREALGVNRVAGMTGARLTDFTDKAASATLAANCKFNSFLSS
jgi:hypothetical protein